MAKAPPSLLLLPPPPTIVSAASLSAAYKPSISGTVSALKTLPTSTELQVVLPCPGLHGRLQRPRSELYHEVQSLLTGVYSLICAVCAHLEVEVESDNPSAVDARILLLNYDGSQSVSEDFVFDAQVAGPIIDLATLAVTRRRWHRIFSVDGEEGQKLLANFTTLANRTTPPLSVPVSTVGGGVSLVQRASDSPRSPPGSVSSHLVVIVAGTFDHLHAGHKLLLTTTALLLQPASKASTAPRRLIVGITGDELLKNKKYAEYLGTWEQRQDDVVDFLLSILCFTRSSSEEAIRTDYLDEPGPNGRAIHTTLKACSIRIECVEIQDPFGPTITDESITALVVSGETRSGGQAVNDKRTDQGWKSLEIFEVDVLNADQTEDEGTETADFGSKISSTAIRKRLAEKASTMVL
ncbi:hypothetical protein G7Y89_g7461 [Cudoniella acicularis]|uniref:Cytidyltransferase-like domain-containing protein n=1 Tax=Cudoniella acicularis TaxID=354080 RepID=A0A8H4RM10_9HELO|nr:hypothetical protein G7Y89_g7461 [Cudoniella acicularis]